MGSELDNTGDSGKGLIEQILEVVTFIVPLVKLLFDNSKDAPAEIKRILSADPALAAMQAEWQSRIDAKFGPG
jgi:hypothetical protein